MDVIERLNIALAGRYVLERELGAGGMATIYLARDLKHGRQVALKVLRPELASVLGPERFLQEIRINAQLDHPHILTLIDSGNAGGLLYYVLPYVRGESLRTRMDRERQLPLAEALAIARQLASALHYAHERGIIHRDVKPENILLHQGEAVIADFGIALAVQEAGGDRLTERGTSLGTPLYMSPEQAMGEHTIDARSDVYSLAAVLYEMLSGEPPHSGTSVQSIVARILSEPATPLTVLRDTVPPRLDEAVRRGLARLPADRYPTAEAFARALGGSESGAMPAAPGSPPRRRQRLVATLAVLGALLAVGWYVVGRANHTGNQRETSHDPRHLAVLYFRSLSGDSLLPLAEGMTEGLIRALNRVSALEVISPNGVLPFRNTSARPDSIADILDVGTLVDGSIANTGAALRVSVSLVDAPTARVLANTTIQLPHEEILALQDSVVDAVALFLRQQLGEDISLKEDRGHTRSAEAWRAYHQARRVAAGVHSLLQTGDTASARRELVRADSLLVRSATLDSRWAAPLTERARLAYLATNLSGNFDSRVYDVWTRRGIGYAAAALALQPDDPDALTIRGILRYWRYILNLGTSPQVVSALGDSAEADFRAAVARDPGQSEAWTSLSHRLMRTNHTAEAKLAALRAYELDPYAPTAGTILWRLFQTSLDLGDVAESTRWCDQGRQRFPEASNFVECQITVQALPGQTPDVARMWRLLDRYVSLFPPPDREFRRARMQMLLALTLLRAGLTDSARSVALRSRMDATRDPSRESVYLEMLFRNIAGDREEALGLAAQWFAANPQDRVDCGESGVENLDPTWWMRGLVADQRYQALVCTGK